MERTVERAVTQVENVVDECFVVQMRVQVQVQARARARAALVPESSHTHVQSARLVLVQ
jgi:hypothetical protein